MIMLVEFRTFCLFCQLCHLCTVAVETLSVWFINFNKPNVVIHGSMCCTKMALCPSCFYATFTFTR